MGYENLLTKSADVWTPSYPRRCAGLVGPEWGQIAVQSSEELVHNLQQVNGTYPGYVSTYSFPDGHPTTNSENIPRIDTLMIDFDVEFEDEEFSKVKWVRNISSLLTRIRMICNTFIERGVDKYWRASLSGYKGVHLYLDFPPIENCGTANQIRNGMKNYTDVVVDTIIDQTSITDLKQFIDVSSGWDLSRLTRLPNTKHEKAIRSFGEDRYCVPVSIKELADIYPEDYIRLTREARELPESCKRNPRLKAKKLIENYIKTAPREKEYRKGTSVKDEAKFRQYKNEVVNDDVTLDDVRFLLSRKPCIWSFRENDNMFNEGHASHIMEMQCILAMSNIGTPIDVMHKFFSHHDEYDEQVTDSRIQEVLSRDYQEFNCQTILEEAPQFCLKQGCKIYQNEESLQRIN